MEKNTVHILNLGCSKNQVDAEHILGEFLQAGFRAVQKPEESRVVVVNTCGFIESAKSESIETILELINRRQPGQRVVVAGCLAQRYMEDLRREMPEADLFTGTYNPGAILQLLGVEHAQEACAGGPRSAITQYAHHAYLKIAEGCNRSCAFCAIPGIRGRQVSRNPNDLLKEARLLREEGVQELTLVAQDLTYYGREKGGPGNSLEYLLKLLLKETDIPWIRLMYAYPAFLEDSLLDLMGTESRICNYLDMPIQHGSDRMLTLMRRGHSGDGLRALLARLRDRVPGIALRTTVLTGFPGETEEDFQELLRLIQDVRFERLGGFTYSPEEGTHAMELQQMAVPSEIAQERLQLIMETQAAISLENNQILVGKELDVIVDEVAEETEYHYLARSQWDALEVDNSVRILEGDATIGSFRRVRIVDAREHDLDAVLL